MFGIEGDVIIALVVFAIIFMFAGSKRMPELARSIGESMRELRKGFSGEDEKKSKDETKSSLTPRTENPYRD